MLTKDTPLSTKQHLQVSPGREETSFPWSPGFLPPSLPRFPLVNLPYPSHQTSRMEQKQDPIEIPFSQSHLPNLKVKQELSPDHRQSNFCDLYHYKEAFVKQETSAKEASFDSLKKMMQRFGPSGMPDYQMFDGNNVFNQQHNDYQVSQQQKMLLSQQQKLFHTQQQQQQLHLKRPHWSDNSLPSLIYNPLVAPINHSSFSKNLDSFYNAKKFNFASNFQKPPGFDEGSFKAASEPVVQDEGTKLFPCRNCSFISSSKEEFEQHSRKHFKYSCSLCNYKSKSEGRLKRHLKHSHENQTEGAADSNDADHNGAEAHDDNYVDGNNLDKDASNDKSTDADDNRNTLKVNDNDGPNESTPPKEISPKGNNIDVKNNSENHVSDSNSSFSPVKLPTSSEKPAFPDTSNDVITDKTEASNNKAPSSSENTTSITSYGTPSNNAEEQSNNKKLSKARVCKICGYVTYDKNDNYQHRSTHFPNMLKCDVAGCRFATQHRHHFLYHMKGHKGEKSYKCTKCNYSCLTRSMLVSHEKCHSYVYRYRCSTCKFSAKHAHALTVHIVKWNHEPAPVLRPDGSLPINDPSSNFENFVRKGRRNKQITKNQMVLNSQFTPTKKSPENGFGKFASMYNNNNNNNNNNNVSSNSNNNNHSLNNDISSASNALQSVQHLQSSAYYQNLMVQRNMMLNMDLSKMPPISRNFLSFPFPPSANPNFPLFKPPPHGTSVSCPQCQKSFENPLAYMNHAFTGQCTKIPLAGLQRPPSPEASDSEDNRSTASNYCNQSFQSNEDADFENEEKENGNEDFKKDAKATEVQAEGDSVKLNGRKSCGALDLSAKKSKFSDSENYDDASVKSYEGHSDGNLSNNENDSNIGEKTSNNERYKESFENFHVGDKDGDLENTSPPPLIPFPENGMLGTGRKSRRKGIAHKLNLSKLGEDADNRANNCTEGEERMKEGDEQEKSFSNVKVENAVKDEIKKEFAEASNSNTDIPQKQFHASECNSQEPDKSTATSNTCQTEHSDSTSHDRSSDSRGDKTYHCKHCQIMFGDKRIYDIHMRFHKPGKPFSCQLCAREYKDGKEFFLHVAQFEHQFKPPTPP